MYCSTTDDGLPYDLLVDGCREPCHTEAICRELKTGDIVVDIGANIGYFALMEARIVGDIGRVYAVEPVSENVQMLKRNIELNGYSNIEVYQLAIGDKNGSSVINISKKCNLSSMKKAKGDVDSKLFVKEQAVQEMTLDDFLEDKPYPSLIRMDTEGYEYNIIKGMTKILDKKLPLVLAIEFHFGILSPDESIALLRSLKIAGFQVLAAACEVRKVGFSKHRFLYNWALYLQRHCNIHPFGNLNLTIDDIISNQDILDGKWGPLNVCFKRS
jgi:FkbM family methyltransferase